MSENGYVVCVKVADINPQADEFLSKLLPSFDEPCSVCGDMCRRAESTPRFYPPDDPVPILTICTPCYRQLPGGVREFGGITPEQSESLLELLNAMMKEKGLSPGSAARFEQFAAAIRDKAGMPLIKMIDEQTTVMGVTDLPDMPPYVRGLITMLGRTGMADFTLSEVTDELPGFMPFWLAQATYDGRNQGVSGYTTVAGRAPEEVISNLAERILDGAVCTSCHAPTLLILPGDEEMLQDIDPSNYCVITWDGAEWTKAHSTTDNGPEAP